MICSGNAMLYFTTNSVDGDECHPTFGDPMTATVDLPVPPLRLYRYRKLADLTDLEQEIAAIKENFLWCSPYRHMNDPMEGLYESSARLRDSPGYKEIV